MKSTKPFLVISFLLITKLTFAHTDTIEFSDNSFFDQLDTTRIITGFLINQVPAAGPAFLKSNGTGNESLLPR